MEGRWREIMAWGVVAVHMIHLPVGDGKILFWDYGENGAGTAILHPEVWDPDSETWTVLTPMDSGGQAYHPRKYHSTALLFKNGEFVTGGGDGYPSAQFFVPPALDNTSPSDRPVINSVTGYSGNIIKCGSTFTVSYTSSHPLVKVTLVRLGSVTHGFNPDQRFLSLPFIIGIDIETGLPTGELSVTAPSNSFHAPPGYYMLFLISRVGNYDVPSIARYVKIEPFSPQ
jgi:hypothetical protein